MKKCVMLFLMCMTALTFGDEIATKGREAEIDIKKEIKELYQPMEEKVFEVDKEKEKNMSEEEKEREKQKRILEAFSLGKARIEFMKERELQLLDLETEAGLERKEEIETLDEKYNKVLEKYKAIKDEQDLLLLENEMYQEYLDRLRKLEEVLYDEANRIDPNKVNINNAKL